MRHMIGLGSPLIGRRPSSPALARQIESGAPADMFISADLDWMKGGHLSMADPDSVPAGKYGKAALQKLGIWNSVEGAIVRAENVRAALLFVSRHEAPLGIVYATDAAADRGVKVAGVFPEDTHPPIVYPIALTAESTNPSAPRLLDFLLAPAAKVAALQIMTRRIPDGFDVSFALEAKQLQDMADAAADQDRQHPERRQSR